MVPPGNREYYLRGRLSTIDLLNMVARFVYKINVFFFTKMS